MKIIGVGMNYALHSKLLNRDDEKAAQPTIFMKPDSAILKDGKPFFIPDFSSRVDYEVELVVRINRLGKNIAPRFSHRYYDEVTVGLDLTARDLQSKYIQIGSPWELSKGFDNSAVLGKFVDKSKFADVQNLNYSLVTNRQVVQEGSTRDMFFTVDELISYISQFVTLKIGDLIFTGAPAGVNVAAVNDHIEGYLEDEKLLDFSVR